MAMCPICGAFDGHYQGCPHLDDPIDRFFPKPEKQKSGEKRRKMFGVKEPEEKEKKT